ncbi:MAG: NTP transferase domain-containing protein [Acidimicrobiia bacterium]|nr:NTP transferase domain-containing protein [Acidimicrobiia bacterium]
MYAALVLAADDVLVDGVPYQVSGEHLAEIVASLLTATDGEVVVVLGAHAEEILDRVDLGDAQVIIDSEWRSGAMSALHVALDWLDRSMPDAEGALIALGVEEVPDAELCRDLVAFHSEDEAGAVVARYRYTAGFPLVLGSVLWPKLMGVDNRSNLMGLLTAHPEWTAHFWVESSSPRRIDAPRPV